jgi:type I restriction-modification system DNA methylase subunit
MSLSTQQILRKFSENTEHYRKKEIGDGTQGFCRDIFESEIFALRSWDTRTPWNYRYEATVEWEGDRGDDFILNIDGIIVPVEVEKLDNIQKWESQIAWYMKRKNALYGILTDGYIWKFYTQWYSKDAPTLVLTLDELVTSEWMAKKNRVFLKKDYYLNSFGSLATLVAQNGEFVLEDFHNDLIWLAEDVRRDFQTAWAFSVGTSEEEQIKWIYSFIIQFILLKIIQDKKNWLDLLGSADVKNYLEEEKWNRLIQHIFKKLEFLWEFYTSYRNEQESLLKKIRDNYTEAQVADYDLNAVKPFLDLYVFIIKYNFRKTNSDLFGAVYENYLKELYREDNTKKWQVFTPPEIVDFMLDEVGYTREYIQSRIEEYGIPEIKEIIAKWAPVWKIDYTADEIEKQYFNIPGLSLIDPACGSGTFLYKAAGRIANAINMLSLTSREKWLLAESLIVNNIVGFDIEAFPLYLAEMNILITLLWHNIDDTTGQILNRIDKQIRVFSTQDSIAEFANSDNAIYETLLNTLEWSSGLVSTILSKRDENEILRLHMDIRDIDPTVFRETLKLRYLKSIIQPQSPWLAKSIQKSKTLDEVRDILTSTRITDTNESIEKTRLLDTYQKLEKTILKQLDTIISDILARHEAHRTKFDFVVGNPPYIANNDIWRNIKDNWSKNNLSMSDIFGVNLHSILEKRKKYPPKPNLYSYFNALAYFLAQTWWKISFIVPEWFVNYDCNNYFLTYQVNLEKLIFFNRKVFVNRWIFWNLETPTSAIVFVYTKFIPKNDDVTLLSAPIINEDNVEVSKVINSLNQKNINHSIFKENIEAWFSIIKKDDFILEKIKVYKNNSNSLSCYYNKDESMKLFGSNFCFDIGFTLDKNIEYLDEVCYYSLKWANLNDYYLNLETLKKFPKNKEYIWLTKNSQWYDLLDKDYYIMISIKNGIYFTFSDYPIIFNMWVASCIWSNNKTEILYLFGILNSNQTRFILNQSKMEWEKDFLVSLTTIKEKIRIPIINSPLKESLKQELIANSEQIIELAKRLQSVRVIWDIFDIEMSGMDEQVKGIKSEFAYIDASILGGVIWGIALSTPLTKDTLKHIRNDNPQMKQLENERDALVERLYEVTS